MPDDTFVVIAVNRLKTGNRCAIALALQLIAFLEKENLGQDMDEADRLFMKMAVCRNSSSRREPLDARIGRLERQRYWMHQMQEWDKPDPDVVFGLPPICHTCEGCNLADLIKGPF